MRWKFWRKEPSWIEVMDKIKISMLNEAMRLERARLEKKEEFRGV